MRRRCQALLRGALLRSGVHALPHCAWFGCFLEAIWQNTLNKSIMKCYERRIAMRRSLCLLLAAIPVILALALPKPSRALIACECDTDALCIQAHNGDRSWYCDLNGPPTSPPICSPVGTFNGLCKQRSGGTICCSACDADPIPPACRHGCSPNC